MRRPIVRAGLAVTLAIAGVLVGRPAMSAPATAGPPVLSLRYTIEEPAAGCPSEADVRSAVAASLGRDPFRDDAPRTVELRLEPGPSGWRARVRLHGPDEHVTATRRLDPPAAACAEVASAAALAIAIAIDPLAINPPPLEAPPAPSPPAPTAPKTRSDTRVERRAGPVSPSVIPYVLAGPYAVIDPSGSILPGAVLGAGLGRGVLALELEARAEWPGRVDVGDDALLLWQTYATLAPCLRSPRSGLAACQVTAVGIQGGRGEGLEGSGTARHLFAALGPRLFWERPLADTLALRLQAEGLFSVTRVTWRSGDLEIWTTPAVLGQAGLSIVGMFP